MLQLSRAHHFLEKVSREQKVSLPSVYARAVKQCNADQDPQKMPLKMVVPVKLESNMWVVDVLSTTQTSTFNLRWAEDFSWRYIIIQAVRKELVRYFAFSDPLFAMMLIALSYDFSVRLQTPPPKK